MKHKIILKSFRWIWPSGFTLTVHLWISCCRL